MHKSDLDKEPEAALTRLLEELRRMLARLGASVDQHLDSLDRGRQGASES